MSTSQIVGYALVFVVLAALMTAVTISTAQKEGWRAAMMFWVMFAVIGGPIFLGAWLIKNG